MAKSSKATSWTKAEFDHLLISYYEKRKAGIYKGEARFLSQMHIPLEWRYSEATIRRGADFPSFLLNGYAEVEQRLATEKMPIALPISVPIKKERVSKPRVEPKPEEIQHLLVEPDDEDAGVDTYVKLLADALRREVKKEMNEKLNKILDYMTAPDSSKETAAKMMYEAVEDRERKPRLLVIGLISSQPHIVRAALQNRFKINFVEANQMGTASAKSLIKGADLVAMMTGFVSHEAESVIRKYLSKDTKWFRHNGGISQLIEKVKSALI